MFPRSKHNCMAVLYNSLVCRFGVFKRNSEYTKFGFRVSVIQRESSCQLFRLKLNSTHAVNQPLLGDSRRLLEVSEAAVNALSLPVDLVCGP